MFVCTVHALDPGEHRRGTCAVECVTAHLRGFEEDSRSEVVFLIDEWSIEFGYHWLMLLMFLTAHLFQFRFLDSEQYCSITSPLRLSVYVVVATSS